MQLWMGAIAAAVVGLAATPGYAGIGQCAWEHLPQAERDRAFAAPSGLPYNHDQFVGNLSAAIPDQDEETALIACGAAKDDNNATTAFAGYIVQHWAEHWMFLYPPHLTTAQLDAAYRTLDPARMGRVGADEIANQSSSDDLVPALAGFKQALGPTGELNADYEAALAVYLAGRAGREAGEAAFGH